MLRHVAIHAAELAGDMLILMVAGVSTEHLDAVYVLSAPVLRSTTPPTCTAAVLLVTRCEYLHTFVLTTLHLDLLGLVLGE